MQPTIFLLALLTVTLGFGVTGPLNERLASTAGAQVAPAQKPAQAQKASQEQAAVKITPTPGAIALYDREDWVYYLAPPSKKPLKLVQGRQAALSPDGKKIAYLKPRKGLGGGKGLMVFDLATGKTVTLLPLLPKRIDGPSWSPGDDLLAFIYNFKEIHLIKADGSGQQKIFSTSDLSDQPPHWTSDVKSLFVNDYGSLIQINLAGQELAKIPLITFTGKEGVVGSGNWFLNNPRIPQLWAFTMAVAGTKSMKRLSPDPILPSFSMTPAPG